jgi:hypothetical protein
MLADANDRLVARVEESAAENAEEVRRRKVYMLTYADVCCRMLTYADVC